MLRRLLWLSFLCLAFCLLLFLAVEKTDEPVKLPVRTQVFYALPIKSAPQETDIKAEVADDQQRVSCSVSVPVLTRQIPGYISRDRPFHLQHFFAFHYSSEAG